ncbi:uncharacterized protein LOC127765403 [Oryza glaberrima]|uniref:uncharacterized protein LOC127765403 n=1 Tax=Oryza glaberrima TaxID=4538 RepID=UPI00224C3E88|nr:uncharacterized protein LOC127765403 [Oryza glaberrima]
MGMEAPDLPAPPRIEVENCFSLSENTGSMVDMINVAARCAFLLCASEISYDVGERYNFASILLHFRYTCCSLHKLLSGPSESEKKAFQKTRSSDWTVTMRANSGLIFAVMILIMCGASAASSDNDELVAPFDTSNGLRTL